MVAVNVYLGCVLLLSLTQVAVLAEATVPLEEQRGMYFAKKKYVPEPLPVYAESKALLPSPILEDNRDWIEMYWACWKMAFDHLRQPQDPFVSNYVDEAFNNNIFQWDTILMVMFWRYAHAVFPAAQSFDNFYCRQHHDGFICREIWETGHLAGVDHHKKTARQAVNPPLFSWAEVEYYRVSGDKQRFAHVFPVLEKYVEWVEKNRRKDSAKHGLYWTDGLGSGMDNTPQRGSAWVEISAQMVRQYDDLALMARALGKTDKAGLYAKRARDIADRMNELMWDEETGFYWNLDDNNHWLKCRTIGFSWPLMAGVATREQAAGVVKNLMDEESFYRIFPFASLAANEKGYDPKGGYWRGSSWAPTTYQAIKGMERYGFEKEASQATEKYLAAMYRVFEETGTVWENYAPEAYTYGVNRNHKARKDFVGWTGCGPIALLIENVIGLRPDAINQRLVWHLNRTDRHGIEKLRVGNATLTLIAEKRANQAAPAELILSSDKPFTVKVVHPNGTSEFRLKPGEPLQAVIEQDR